MGGATDGMSFPTALLRTVEESLDFAWDAGAETPVAHPHTTGWRALPCLVTAHVLGARFRLDLDGGGAEHAAGGCLCLPENVHHRSTLVPPDAGVSRWSHVRFRILGAVDPLRLFDLPPVIAGPAAAAIGEVNLELAALAQPSDLVAVARRRALGFRLLALVAAGGRPRPEGAELLRSAERLAPALAALEADLHRARLDLPHLARSVGLSPSRFHAVFRAGLGVSPTRWWQERRLARARELLAGSDLPVHRVAECAGFNDPFHFSRLFKRRHGAAPADYRAACRRF